MSDTKRALAWLNYSKNKDLDDISRFMMRWMAFNWLYSEYSNCGLASDPVSIYSLCSDKKDVLLKYDPFDDDNTIAIFLKAPVLDDKYARFKDSDKPEVRRRYEKALERAEEHHRVLNTNKGKNTKEKMTSLLLTIYQVRCNLFHGSKLPREKEETRDSSLVDSSAEIMKGYLEKLLDINPYSE